MYIEERVGDKVYRFAQMSNRHKAAIIEWAQSRIPDPVAELMEFVQSLPADMRKDFLKDNFRQAVSDRRNMKSLTNPALNEVLHTQEGMVHIFRVLLSDNHPGMSDAELLDVVLALAQRGDKEFKSVLTRIAFVQPLKQEEAEREFFRAEGLVAETVVG